MTCADASTIVDDSAAPFAWAGEDACTTWLKAIGRTPGSSSIARETAELLEPKRITVREGYAYAVVPVNVVIRREGQPEQSHLGLLTVALQRAGTAWLINALTYSPQ